MSCLFCSSLLLTIGFIIIFTLVDSIAVVIVVHIHIGRKASRVNVAVVCYRLLTSTTVLKKALIKLSTLACCMGKMLATKADRPTAMPYQLAGPAPGRIIGSQC